MNFPLAVAPSVRSPGLAMRVDLLAAAASPGAGALLSVLIASASAAGALEDNVLYESLAGPDDAATQLGAGAPGHLGAKAWFKENPLGRLDLISPPEAATKATGTFTFTGGPVTVARTVKARVAGRTIEFVWAAGETFSDAATRLAGLINGKSADMPVTASALAGVVTVTFKIGGTIGNDCTISVEVSGGAPTGATCAVSAATLAGGAGTADVETALSAISGQEYAYIIDASNGNAETNAASTTSSVGKIVTHVDQLDTGFSAKLQQIVVGLTGALSGAKTGAAQHNFGPLQYVLMKDGLSLPAELACAEAGARAREESIDPATNRINTPYVATLYPPASLVTGALTEAQVEDALQSGVTPVTYTSAGKARPSRPITTYWKDAAGNPDGRLLDTSRVTGVYAIGRDLRSALPAEFPRAKLSKDLAPGAKAPPAGVIEERDVKAFITNRMSFWVSAGVVQQESFDAAVAAGTFLVRVNPSDPSQCDIAVPFGIVPPLAKFSLVLLHTGPQ